MKAEVSKTPIITHQFLTITIHDQEFAVRVPELKEIIPAKKITPLPHMSKHQKGFIYLRRKAVPIIDISLFLKKPEMTELTGFYVILNTEKNSQYGFWVSKANSIETVSDKDILPLTGKSKNDWAQSVIKIKNKSIIVLETKSINKH